MSRGTDFVCYDPPMAIDDLIESRRDVLGGKPCLKGTRISVELILERASAGATEDDIIESYPHLTREQIRAAFAYAAESLSMERIIFVGDER